VFPLDLVGLVAKGDFVPFHRTSADNLKQMNPAGASLGMALSAITRTPDPHHDAGGAAADYIRTPGQGPLRAIDRVAHALRNALILW